jgi:hypothetical protein
VFIAIILFAVGKINTFLSFRQENLQKYRFAPKYCPKKQKSEDGKKEKRKAVALTGRIS